MGESMKAQCLVGSSPSVRPAALAALDVEPGPAARPDLSGREPALQHVGRYDIRRRLAEGSWGPVYEASDPVAQKTTALRIVSLNLPEHARPAVDGLFMTALRPLVGLRHAHIAATFEVGVVAEGVYIAGEWLQGRSLVEVLRGGWRASPTQAASLVQQVVVALAHAHAHAVVHGGVAPACVWLDPSGKVRLQGFALALAAQASQLPDLDPLVVGPGHYVAPEQLSGGQVGAVTDVHGAGVLLYELLCGQKAFPGHTVPEVVSALLKHAPTAPHLQRPEVPKALSEIVMRAIETDPAARFATAQDMAQALQRWLQQAPGSEPADLAGWALPDKQAKGKGTGNANGQALPGPGLQQSTTTILAGPAAAAALADESETELLQDQTGHPGAARIAAGTQSLSAVPSSKVTAKDPRRSGPHAQPEAASKPTAKTKRERKKRSAESEARLQGTDTADTLDAPLRPVRGAQWQPKGASHNAMRWLLVAATLCGAGVLFLALR